MKLGGRRRASSSSSSLSCRPARLCLPTPSCCLPLDPCSPTIRPISRTLVVGFLLAAASLTYLILLARSPASPRATSFLSPLLSPLFPPPTSSRMAPLSFLTVAPKAKHTATVIFGKELTSHLQSPSVLTGRMPTCSPRPRRLWRWLASGRPDAELGSPARPSRPLEESKVEGMALTDRSCPAYAKQVKWILPNAVSLACRPPQLQPSWSSSTD